MVLWLCYVVAALCLALTGWAVVFIVRDRAVVLRQLWAALGVEILLVAQTVMTAVQLAGGGGPRNPALLWGYLVAGLVILPAAALWAFAERTRWSSVVLAAAAFVVAFLQWRLWQIWTAS